MEYSFTIEEFNEEVIRAKRSYIAIVNVFLLAQRNMNPNIGTIRKHAFQASLVWSEITQLIENGSNGFPLITQEQLDGTQDWRYYRLPRIAVDKARLSAMFDFCKAIEGVYDLESYYENFSLAIDLPENSQDGAGEQAVPTSPSYGEAIITRDLPVTGLDYIGGYYKGEILEKNTTVTNAFAKLLDAKQPPEYLMPYLAVYTNYYEYAIVPVLSRIDYYFEAQFIQRDGGEMKEARFSLSSGNGSFYEVSSGLNLAYNFKDLFFSTDQSEYQLKLEVDYGDGEIKENDDRGSIKAGTLTKIITMKAAYSVYIFSSLGKISEWNNSFLSGFAGYATGNTFEFEGQLNVLSEEKHHYMNVLVPPGWELDSIVSVLNPELPIPDPLFQLSSGVASSFNLFNVPSGLLESESSQGMDQMTITYNVRDAFANAGFSKTMRYKIKLRRIIT